MKIVFRLYRQKHPPFDGQGAFLRASRWTSKGVRVIYTAENRALAQLEYLVHIDLSDIPPDLAMAQAGIPNNVSRKKVAMNALPANWRSFPTPESLREIGDRWARAKESCILIVPSVVEPAEENWILNPEHSDFGHIDLSAPPMKFDYDERLLGS